MAKKSKERNNERPELKIDFKYNFKVYFQLLSKYKYLTFFIILIGILLEARMVLDRFIFKIIIDNGTEYVKGNLLPSDFTSIMIILAGVFILIVILTAIFRWVHLHLVNILEGGLILDLKRKYFNHLINLDHSFHVSHKTGSLISRLTRGAGATERMTDVFIFNMGPLIFELIIVIASLIYFDYISAIIMAISVISFISFSFVIQRIQGKANLEANKNEDIEKANIADIFTNIDSIQYFGKEELIKRKFEELTDTTKASFIKNWNYFRWNDFGQAIIIGLGAFFLVYFSIINFLSGKITLGTLAFIYTLYLSLISSMYGFVHGVRGFYRAMADYQDLFSYGKIEKQIKDSIESKQLEIKEGEIEFKDVNFNYEKRKIFEKFNLKIPKNKKIALVGHSGSGKTTLIKLLYRMYDVNSGAILIDSEDIRNVKQESLRNEMAIVPQECVLFDDTIYNNVLFSKPDAKREEVLNAIKFAHLDKIIEEFSNKENTIVGERGVKLSGGEKQRVSIARAILANKKVLVLDEATSSLDSKTESEIQEDLKRLMVGRTTIIIAHRLSTIISADTIVVMEKGKIVQMGNHEELIKQDGQYKKLWELQKGGYIK